MVTKHIDCPHCGKSTLCVENSYKTVCRSCNGIIDVFDEEFREDESDNSGTYEEYSDDDREISYVEIKNTNTIENASLTESYEHVDKDVYTGNANDDNSSSGNVNEYYSYDKNSSGNANEYDIDDDDSDANANEYNNDDDDSDANANENNNDDEDSDGNSSENNNDDEDSDGNSSENNNYYNDNSSYGEVSKENRGSGTNGSEYLSDSRKLNKSKEEIELPGNKKDNLVNLKSERKKAVERYLSLAASALEDGNIQEANEYFCRGINISPENHEAIFGKTLTYCRLANTVNFQLIETTRQFDMAIDLAPDELKETYRKDAAKELTNFAFISTESLYKNFMSHISKDTYNNYISKMKVLLLTFDMALYYKQDDVEILQKKILCLKNFVKKFKNPIDDSSLALPDKLHSNSLKAIQQIQDKIKDINSNINASTDDKGETERGKEKGKCYIATKVYMSYDAPEVKILRIYRDNHLKNRLLGRVFISVYYLVGPIFVNLMGENKYAKRIVKKLLDYIIFKIYNCQF